MKLTKEQLRALVIEQLEEQSFHDPSKSPAELHKQAAIEKQFEVYQLLGKVGKEMVELSKINPSLETFIKSSLQQLIAIRNRLK